MSVIATIRRLQRPLHAEDGFTMIIALGVMLVTSLLLTAAFTVSDSNIHLSRQDTLQKQAYYAALSGVQEYEYQLQNNPSYWASCGAPEGTEGNERYEVTVLGANGNKTCNAAKPFETAIESANAVANTFRIKSTGCAGRTEMKSCEGQSAANTKKHSVVATFQVKGFLDYVYFTKYEDLDPYLSGQPAAECERYYEEGGTTRSSECVNITFAQRDSVHGPMHTNDTARVECSKELVFGRSPQTPPDSIEMNGGPTPCSAGTEPTYNTTSKKPSKGEELSPPESDTSLKLYVEPKNLFTGTTHLTLKGEEITVTRYKEEANGSLKEVSEPIKWPANGLIFVQKNAKQGCGYTFSESNTEADSTAETENEKGCGNVYVNGTFSKSLTVAGENEVIVNGSITPTGVTPGNPPTGTATVGLIATYFVRIFHPCSSGVDGAGSLKDPWIYAANLSTAHSFIVDNYSCGNAANLGKLNIYGAIAQKYRGPVGTTGGGSGTGYKKEYVYDERLATDEPPYFLAPLKAGWKVARVTAAEGG